LAPLSTFSFISNLHSRDRKIKNPLLLLLLLLLSLSLSMAPHFVFPRTLEELEHEHEDDNRLCVQNPVDVASFVSSKLEEFVKGKPISLFHSSSSIPNFLLFFQVCPLISPTGRFCASRSRTSSTVSTPWFAPSPFSPLPPNSASSKRSAPTSPSSSPTWIPFPEPPTTTSPSPLTATLSKSTPSSSSPFCSLYTPTPPRFVPSHVSNVPFRFSTRRTH